MKANRLLGHSIQNEGRLDDSCTPWSERNGMGAVRCSCGEWSPQLPSTNARQKWHRSHKDDVRGLSSGSYLTNSQEDPRA